MNNSNFFANPIKPVHFLSVFTYINTLSNVFYNKNLITTEDRFKPIPVVNTLSEYLHKNNESADAKRFLSHILLKDTDFYGSKDNETVDLDYINAMFDHIIASTVFSKYINSFGYLATLVNSTNNLTLSFFKSKITQDFENAKYLNEDGSISNLSELTVKWVTEKLIFPLFPVPESDMKIIDMDYIYAQAGSMLARTARMNSHNISFDQYIAISQSIHEAVIQGQIDKSALRIFDLPAMLYFAYKEKKVFRKEMIVNIITSENFWTDAYNLLFSDLNVTYEKLTKLLEENPAYQFNMAFSAYKNRSQLAEDTLRNLCPLENESEYADEVNEYKYYYSNCYCKSDRNRLLPNINELFTEQNKKIAEKFFLLEKAMIRETFDDDLRKLIDSNNVIIYPLEVVPQKLGPRYSVQQKVNSSVDLFRIRINNIPHSYALVRNENHMSLFSSDSNKELFTQKLGLKKGLKFIPPFGSKPIKDYSQKFEDFLTNIAKPRADKFKDQLYLYGYDATTGEKVIEVLKSFIPFHPCKEAYDGGKTEEIALLCMLDFLSVIPAAGGLVNIGFKFANAGLKSLLIGVGSNLKTFALRTSISLVLKSGIGVISVELAKELSKLITVELFKDLAIATFRLLDPGLELAYTLGKAAVKAIFNLFSTLGKKLLSFSRIVKSFKNVKQTIEVSPKEVGLFNDHKVYVDSISGVDGYGPRYIHLPKGNAEFRRILGYKSEQLVIVTRVTKKGKEIYKRIDLETLETLGLELDIRNNVLQMVVPPLAVRLEMIKEIGLSGRGNLRNERLAEQIARNSEREEAVVLLEKYKRIPKDEAREILSHYVLEEPKRPAMFAAEWILSGVVPEWSKELKLLDKSIFESLRYAPYLEDLSLTKEVAAQRIIDLYGESYVMEVIKVNPLQFAELYLTNKLHTSISFEDYYAVVNWIGLGFMRISFSHPEAWRMQRALYKLALRQTDSSIGLLPELLYRGESSIEHNIDSLSVGHTFEFNRFVSFSAKSKIAEGFLDLEIEEEWATKILYELKLDSSHLAANIYRVFPTALEECVILPGVKFVIEKLESIMMEGRTVLKVHMKNVPISKSKWLTQITNNIKLRQDWENQFLDAVNDFDISLLE